MSSHDPLDPQENRLPSESNTPGLVENHNSHGDDSSSQFTGDALVTDQRYQRGLEVFASELQMPREEVASWFAEHVGERFSEEAILSVASIWVDDDELSLRDRSLIVIATLITQGDDEPQLRAHTRWAIHHGCTRSQLEALATVLGVYAGQPRAVNGLMVMREELAKLEEQ
jgi:4-carboxymuconolactone decarboxylase